MIASQKISVADLKSEHGKIRQELERELLTGRKLLDKNNANYDLKVTLRNINICVLRLNAFSDKLDGLNENLSLAVDGTELQYDFEQQMMVDFELMDMALELSDKLNCLKISLETVKSNKDSSKTITEEYFDKVLMVQSQQLEQLISIQMIDKQQGLQLKQQLKQIQNQNRTVRESQIIINQTHENRKCQYDQSTANEKEQNISNQKTQDKTSQDNQQTSIQGHKAMAVRKDQNITNSFGQDNSNQTHQGALNQIAQPTSNQKHKQHKKREKQRMRKMKKEQMRTLPALKLPFNIEKVTDGKPWIKFPRRKKKYRIKKPKYNKRGKNQRYQIKSRKRRKKMHSKCKTRLFVRIWARVQVLQKWNLKKVKRIGSIKWFCYSGILFKCDNLNKTTGIIPSKTSSVETNKESRKKQNLQRKKKRKKLFNDNNRKLKSNCKKRFKWKSKPSITIF